jgi:prepilin-type N-terminal cleavage/methylation domain-containing protein
MRTHGRRNCRAAGFTLVEMAIVTVVFATLMGAFALVSVTSHNTYRESSHSAALDQRLRQTLDKLSAEMRVVAGSLMTPDPQTAFGTSQIDFRQALGIANGNVTWGALTRLGFEYAPGELDDGLDNDGNGIVDDGLIVLTRGLGGGAAQRIVLCRGVRETVPGEPVNGLDDNGNGVTDEGGFNLQRVGDLMFIRISIEGPGLDGTTIVRTGQTSVRLRNIKA